MAFPSHLEKNMLTLFDGVSAPNTPVDLKSSGIRVYGRPDGWGLWVQATGTTPRLSIELEGAPDDVDGLYAPIEGSSPVLTIADGAAHMVNLAVDVIPHNAYVRARVRDTAGNGANTAATVKLFRPA